MKSIATEIQISAPPEDVWEILTDFEAYGEWNPFITSLQGHVITGNRLTVSISPPHGKAMVFKPTVKSVIHNKEFRWLGNVLLPGIFDGEHIFTLQANDSGCLFRQKENFSGLLVPLLWKSMKANVQQGFEEMNKALKKRVERQAALNP